MQIPLQLSYNPETKIKLCQSPFYNYRFDGKTGEFMRWGKTFQDDPKIGALEFSTWKFRPSVMASATDPVSIATNLTQPKAKI